MYQTPIIKTYETLETNFIPPENVYCILHLFLFTVQSWAPVDPDVSFSNIRLIEKYLLKRRLVLPGQQ